MYSRSPWFKARSTEAWYSRELRKIAREIGRIVTGLGSHEDLTFSSRVMDAMRRYGELLDPWAHYAALAIVDRVDAQDYRAWMSGAVRMSNSLKRELKSAPVGQLLQDMQAEQVTLIKSLPIEAGQRVHRLVQQNMAGANVRSSEIAKEIARTGEVTASRAKLIARTETSRIAANLTRARAEHIGSVQFVWRTSHDSDVRPSHRRLDGQAYRWDQPPECDPGIHALPGGVFNCRCYPEPLLPARIE